MITDPEKMKRNLTKALHWAAYSVLKKFNKIDPAKDEQISMLKAVFLRICVHSDKLGWTEVPRTSIKVVALPLSEEDKKRRVAPIIQWGFCSE